MKLFRHTFWNTDGSDHRVAGRPAVLQRDFCADFHENLKKLGKEISWNLAETSEYFRGGRSGKTKT